MIHSEDLLNKVLDKLVASTHSPRGRFSATSTYPILQHRLFGKRHLFLHRSIAAAAAIAILCLAGWWGYQYNDADKLIAVYAQAEIQSIQLSDGTRITLNRYSKITYPKHFDKQRDIQLEGEAYFEVKHDSKRPFTVKTANIEIKDIGTRFNVEAYRQSQHIKTTLIEGSISVKSAAIHRTAPIELKPGESITWDKRNNLFSRQSNPLTANTIAWRDGSFIFDNCPMGEVAERLSNSFNTPILLHDKKLANYRINARFCHKEDLATILTVLQKAGHFDYKTLNKKIVLYKN